MNVNLRGVFLFCKAVIPFLRKGNRGRIINIGGLSGKICWRNGSADSCSAGAALTRSVALNSAQNITVNAVLPGLHQRQQTRRLFRRTVGEIYNIDGETAIANTIQRTLAKRNETLEEVAETAASLCTEGAGAITGQNLNVNCGLANEPILIFVW